MARPLPPSLNALRAFEATARLGSMSAAAGELHVTHGAVSRQIRLLEDELGMPLFTRTGRGLQLTHAGRHLFDASSTAFERILAATLELRRHASPKTRVLGCPGSVLARWVIPRMGHLARDLPDLKLHLSAHDGPFEPSLPGLDAVLMIGEPPWPSEWQVHTLAPERIGPVISPRHSDFDTLLHHSPAALLESPLLHTASRPQAWPTWAARHGLDPAGLRYGTGFEHLYYLLEAAVAGLGVAIAPEPLVADDIAAGRLAAPWGFIETDACWCLCTRRNARDEHIEQLAVWLRQALETESD